MKIQTNTAANSALGYMKVNAQNTERSIQKLSSGFRINRAADDAAGLAIANQLRADAKTLGQAQKNAAQASAMLQIADGAASTLGNIFDRMRELASQGASANIGGQGTKLQDEWNALYKEADRLITGTKYQGTNVLTSLNGQAATTAAAGTAALSGATAGQTASLAAAGISASSGATNAANGSYSISVSGNTMTLTGPGGTTATASTTPSGGKITFASAGIEINTSGSYVAGSAGTAASSGTAGSFTGDITGVTTLPASMSGSNAGYEIRDGAAGALELWTTGGGAAKVGETSGAVTSGAASATFDNGAVISLSGFTQASAGSAATTGTSSALTANLTTVTNATQDAAENGSYAFVDDGGTGVKLQKGGVDVPGATVANASITSGATLTFGNFSVTLDAGVSSQADLIGQTFTFGGAAATVPPTASSANNDTFAVSGYSAGSGAVANSLDGATFAVTGQTVTAAAVAAPSILVGTSASQATGTLAQRAAVYDSADSIQLSLGSLDDMDIKNLSSSVNSGAGAAATGANLTTTAGAKDALARLDLAQEKLNTFVGKLGAAQSRVDYASQNVDSMLQNTQAAESSIRDADMAKEMSAFTKNNILQQAAQSMLSQANQGTQGILQLLRG